jgi:REP element-mobilizing transposase RayT
MVIAYHLIWTLYGWWLPNDLRGSTSRVIRNDLLKELGELHFGRKKVQPATRDLKAFFVRASEVLKYPLLTLGPEEYQLVAAAMRDVIKRNQYTCYACALMPDHVHIAIRKHRDFAEDMIASFQDATRAALQATDKWRDHPVWGGLGWKVFLDSTDDVWRTIPYIKNNPRKIHLPNQTWDFVELYNNWPLHKK